MRVVRALAINGAAVLLCMAAAGATAADTAVATFKVKVSSHDRDQITAIACASIGSPGLDRLDAWTQKKGSSRIEATARCKPHDSRESLPVARHANCDNLSGRWTCDAGRDALLITQPDKSVLALMPSAVPLRTAIDVVREAMGLTLPPFYTSALPLLKDQCTVEQLGKAEFKGATHFRIECTHGTLLLTRDCWNEKKCRYFITSGTEHTA